MTIDDSPTGMRIDVLPNGPYKVSGGIPLEIMSIVRNEEKEAVGWEQVGVLSQKDTYVLCRCGKSKNMPYCDGVHFAAGFDGTETASKEPYEQSAERIYGDEIVLYDKPELCIGAEFCLRLGGTWNLTRTTVENSDISDSKEAAEYVQKAHAAAIEQAHNCPAGRLVMHKILEGREIVIESEHNEPSIALIEDPAFRVSCALWVRGKIPLYDGQGEPYEVRDYVTLCRCGASANMPYCDGRHYSVEFNDGILQDKKG